MGESQAHPRERTFTCERCGLILDRDLNAARNLAKLVESVAQSGWEAQTARGADRKSQLAGQVVMKRKPAPNLVRVRPAPSSRKAGLPDQAPRTDAQAQVTEDPP
jgi:transposase